MHYFLDGYNLLFCLLRTGDDLQKQREELIRDLQMKVNFLKLDVTVVFDAYGKGDDISRSHLNSLEVIYTPSGKTADDYIIEALRESPSPVQHIVVTSDKKLAWQCRRRFAKTQTSEEFIAWLNKSYKNRRRKEKDKRLNIAKPLVPAITETLPKRQKPPQDLPKKNMSAEACLEYYLDIFEKNYQQTITDSEPQKKEQKAKPSKKIKKSKASSTEGPFLSEMERWLKAFDRENLDDQDD